jgi:hypothetical protein
VLQNSTVIVDTEVQWTSRGQQESKVVQTGSSSRSPQKGSPSKKYQRDLNENEPLGLHEGEDIMGIEPLKLHKSKVCTSRNSKICHIIHCQSDI